MGEVLVGLQSRGWRCGEQEQAGSGDPSASSQTFVVQCSKSGLGDLCMTLRDGRAPP